MVRSGPSMKINYFKHLWSQATIKVIMQKCFR